MDSDEPSQIFLKVMKTVAVKVSSRDTINNIKAMVFAAEGVGISQQKLFFAGNHLEDTKTLADYNIPMNSTINLYLSDGMQIFIKIPTTGKCIMLEVNKRETVHSVKVKIQDKEGIPMNQQAFMYSGRLLEDNQTLIACDIKQDATLHLIIRPTDEFYVAVNMMYEKTITLEVRSWFTIGDVKLIIESLEGVPAYQQRLSFAGNLLEDNFTLSDHNINGKSTLQLLPLSIQIFIKPSRGKTLTIMVEKNDTVAEVIDKIEKKMQFRLKQHSLSYAGKILQDDKKLSDYRIEAESTIYLRARASCAAPCESIDIECE